MDAATIKLKTIQFINGLKHLSEQQATDVCYIICHNLGIDKNEDNFNIVRDGLKLYFDLQNKVEIV